MIERIQLKYFKYIFNLKKTIPSYIVVYRELGLTALSDGIQTRLSSFWSKLIVNHDNNKLSSEIYNIVYELHSAYVIKSKWVDNVKELFCSLGFSGTSTMLFKLKMASKGTKSET